MECSDACVVTVVVVVEEVEVVTAFESGPFASGLVCSFVVCPPTEVVCPPTEVGGSTCFDPVLEPNPPGTGVRLPFVVGGAAESDGIAVGGEEGSDVEAACSTGVVDRGGPPVGCSIFLPEQAVARRPMDTNKAHAHSPGR